MSLQLPVQPLDIDKGFVCSLIAENDIALALKEKIEPNWLKEPYDDIFTFLKNFYVQFGKVPDPETVQARFGFFYAAPKETLRFYCDRVKDRKRKESLLGLAKEIIDKNEAAKAAPIPQQQMLVADLEKLVMDFTSQYALSLAKSETDDVTANIQVRDQDYQRRKDPEYIRKTFIPTPWEPLNEQIIGFQGGDLVTILGKSGLGKTWLMLLCLVHASRMGKKVLLFTKEMTIRQLGLRLDALMSGLPYRALARSELDPIQEAEYFAFLQDLAHKRASGNLSPFYIDQGSDSGGIQLMQAKIRAIKPDIVGLDGGYLFAGGYKWEKQGELTGGFKDALMLNNIPGIVTNQEGSKGSSTAAANSPTYVNDASVVLRLVSDGGDLPFMGIEAIKLRDGFQRRVKWTCDWDFERMAFGYRADLSQTQARMEQTDGHGMPLFAVSREDQS